MKYENHHGNKSVFGIFGERSALETAVDRLKAHGFRSSDISVLMPTPESTKNFAHEKATKAPEGAATGAVSGTALGGALGWLVGAGALAVPGIGPFVAAGPIMAALAGAGIGGALGGMTGALIGLGIPEYEAKRYETVVREGGMLLSVHVDDGEWLNRAEEILRDCGGRGISSSTEARVMSTEEEIDPTPPPTVGDSRPVTGYETRA